MEPIKKHLFKRPTTIVVILGLIAALWAAPAYADELAAGEVSDAAPSAVDMYVVSKIGDMTCTYNKNGLLTKRENTSTAVTFKYAGTNIKSYASKFKHGSSSSTTKATLAYNAKGKLVKLTVKGPTGTSVDTYTYNKAGNVKKYTHEATNQKSVRYTCKYDAEGRLISQNASGGDSTKTTFGYDEKGNLSSATYKFGLGGSVRTYANKYNKAGRLVQRVTTITSAGSYSTSTAYEYAKISVPAQYADVVAKQQWALLNPQVSFSYPLNY